MTRKSPPPIFLQRASYRQRRLRDAAKLMPFVGAILWAIPLAWSSQADGGPSATSALIYVFSVWVLLILITAFMATRIKRDTGHDDTGPDAT